MLEDAKQIHKGQCFCGAIELQVKGDSMAMGYCHCSDCQQWSGCPVTAFTLWPHSAVQITKGEGHLKKFSRNGYTERMHCDQCGGLVMSQTPNFADVYAGILPTLDFTPSMHVHYASSILPIKDGLVKFKDFPKEAGGSGEIIPE